MRELTHLSLFSGIGGLDLAAEWAGFKTIGQCEWADYPTKVLEKHWPDVPRWKDIRTLTKESFYEKTGRRTVDIVSGGFPCQPFSVAGKQRGKEDDRYLWPEMVRVIKELRPTWIVGENVAGIVRMALPDILSELETCGYRTRAFLIPACAVGARHRRYRVAIVGYSEHNGLSPAAVAGSTQTAGGGQQEREEAAGESSGTGKPGNGPAMGRTQTMENTGCRGFRQPGNVREQPGRAKPERTGEVMDDAYTERKSQSTGNKQNIGNGTCIGGENVADSNSTRLQTKGTKQQAEGITRASSDVQHAYSTGCKEQYAAAEPDKKGFTGRGCDVGNVCDTAIQGLPDGTGEPPGGQGTPEPQSERPDSDVSDPDYRFSKWENEKVQSGRDSTYRGGTGERKRTTKSILGGMADGISGGMDGDLDFLINHYWDMEPDIPRIASGVEHRADRLKALGNAVVPQQFYLILRYIWEIEYMIQTGQLRFA